MGPLLGGARVLSQCILIVFPSYVFKGRLQGEPPQKRRSTAYILKDILRVKWELGGSGGNEMRFIWIQQQCNSHHVHLTFMTWRS